MFSKKDTSQETNRVMAGMTFTGDVDIEGDIRIDGRIVGMVRADGKIVLGESGTIEGDVSCDSADVSGKILGTVVVEGILRTRATSLIRGDVFVGMLESQVGSKMYGKISLGPEWKDEIEKALTENGKRETPKNSSAESEKSKTSGESTAATQKPKRQYTKRSTGTPKAG